MQELRELDANAKAVEILVRVKGLSERQALTTMVVYLRARPGVPGQGNPNAAGHLPPAEEIADLLRALPGRRHRGAPRHPPDRRGAGVSRRPDPSSGLEGGRSLDVLVVEPDRGRHVCLDHGS